MKHITICLGAVLIAAAVTSSHPSDNGQIDPRLVNVYAQSAFELESNSLGGMRFHGPDHAVPADELSHAEKYILFGVRTSSMPDGGPMQPWSQVVYDFAQMYYRNHGTSPGRLSEELVRQEYANAGYSGASAELINALRSPLTGEWPRLDATEFSRGDCMIRPLTAAEIDHLAAKSSYYRMLFKEHRSFNLSTGQIGPIKLVQEPFYVRIYGETKPLVEMIQYGTQPD